MVRGKRFWYTVNSMFFSFTMLVAGITLLIYGARFLIDSASSLARRLGISALVVGLTVVAFGTSAPELIVNLVASMQGKADIVIGNILGSNLANILIILGIASLIYPLKVKVSTAWKEIPFSLLAVLAIGIVANDAFIDRLDVSSIARSEGIILLFFFIIFLYYTYGISKASKEEWPGIKIFGLSRSLFMFGGGLGALFLGGKLTVEGASAIARGFSVSEALIGLTIVAIGTSLPELVTSVVAAHKRQADIAIGNIVGSNILNIFFVLGTSAAVRAIPFAPAFNVDLGFVIIATLLLFLALFVGKRHILERWQGGFFITLYAAYLIYVIFRG